MIQDTMCQECYSINNKLTPLRNALDCLVNHTQYICGNCGRCICIERDPNRNLQRWNFPFSSLEDAKLYLRTADATTKGSCAIYELQSTKGRISYKIFKDKTELIGYLQKNKDKNCLSMSSVYLVKEYKEYASTQVRRLTSTEIKEYMNTK